MRTKANYQGLGRDCSGTLTDAPESEDHHFCDKLSENELASRNVELRQVASCQLERSISNSIQWRCMSQGDLRIELFGTRGSTTAYTVRDFLQRSVAPFRRIEIAATG